MHSLNRSLQRMFHIPMRRRILFHNRRRVFITAAAVTTLCVAYRQNIGAQPEPPVPWSPLFVSRKTSIMTLDDDETIYDYYEFGDILGQGGFSVVYQGTCLETKSKVAIKVVDKENSNLADVKNEIAIMVKTGIHPNIVSLHAAYDTEKAYILILDLVRGGEVRCRHLLSLFHYVHTNQHHQGI